MNTKIKKRNIQSGYVNDLYCSKLYHRIVCNHIMVISRVECTVLPPSEVKYFYSHLLSKTSEWLEASGK